MGSQQETSVKLNEIKTGEYMSQPLFACHQMLSSLCKGCHEINVNYQIRFNEKRLR